MRLRLLSGSYIDCEDSPLRSGADGQVFLTSDRLSVIKLYKKPRNSHKRRLTAMLPWGKALAVNQRLSENIVWFSDLVVEPTLGIVMPYVPEHVHNLGWYTSPTKFRTLARKTSVQSGNWLDRVLVASRISEVVAYLHENEITLCDLSPRNILIDLMTHMVRFVDCDSFIVPGEQTSITLGTLGYSAPEVLTNGQPSILGDLHSLAVIIYEILFLRHPLQGPLVNSVDPDEDNLLTFGDKALFIEHPINSANRPTNLTIKSSDFGRGLFEIVLRAFVDGLHAPINRPTAREWHEVLATLGEELVPCSNEQCVGRYSLPTSNNTRCYWCSMPLKLPDTPVMVSSTLTSNTLSPQTVFVSYSRRDWSEYVLPLIERLNKEGITTWVDQHLLKNGDNWLDEINYALEKCNRLILCISPEALASRFVKMEYRYFVAQGKQVYPLICRETPLPIELQGIQYLPYQKLDDLIRLLSSTGVQLI